MTESCPLCGVAALEGRSGVYRFPLAPLGKEGEIVVSGASWEHCGACGEDLLPADVGNAIELLGGSE